MALVDMFGTSGTGDGDISMGVAIDAGKIRSSRFIASD